MTQARPFLRVLVVEDDAASQSALVRLLKGMRFAASSADSLAAARREIAEAEPDLLILDLYLPDGDGTDLLAEIRTQRRAIKVAVVTAVSDRLKLHEVTRWNPDALFGKPIDIADFRNWLAVQQSQRFISVELHTHRQASEAKV